MMETESSTLSSSSQYSDSRLVDVGHRFYRAAKLVTILAALPAWAGEDEVMMRARQAAERDLRTVAGMYYDVSSEIGGDDDDA